MGNRALAPLRGKAEHAPIGLDTETHRGRAILICSPTESCEPRNWRACADFLLTRPRWVAWNVTYDAQAVLAYLPAKVKRTLGTFTRATHDGYTLRYVPGKFLQVWHGRNSKRRTALLTDAFPFYQSSLEAAARKVLGEGKSPVPKAWMTEMLACMGDGRRDTVIAYCKRDAELAQRLFENVAAGMRKLGITVQRPVSPATFSAAFFKGKLKSTRYDLNRIALRAYYGGRIETFQRGYFPRLSVIDLHSAYPAEEAELQDTDACSIIECPVPRADAAYGLFRLKLEIAPGEDRYLLPRETPGGTIVFPAGRWKGWYDLDSTRAAIEAGYGVTILKGFQWIINEERKPFRAGIRRLYRLREKPELKQAAKLILNATYGKMAQRQPRHKRARSIQPGMPVAWDDAGRAYLTVMDWPRTTNLVYASHVTARTRLKLWAALNAAGSRAVFCHTDSVAFTGPAPRGLDYGPEMGQWDKQKTGAAIVVGSGIYGMRPPRGRKWDWSTRGFHITDLTAEMRRKQSAISLRLTELRAKSLAQLANTRNPSWESLNALEYLPRSLDLGFDRKRVWPRRHPNAGFLLKHSETSRPWIYFGGFRP